MEKYLEDHNNCKNDKIDYIREHNHKDKETFTKDKTIRGLPVIDQHEEKAAGLQCITRFLTKEKSKQKSENGVSVSNRQLLSLVKELHRGLSTEVYDAQAMRIIEISRKVLDVTSLGVKLKDISFIKLSCLEFPNLKQAITEIPISDLKSIPEDELRYRHKKFMQRLECVTKKFSI